MTDEQTPSPAQPERELSEEAKLNEENLQFISLMYLVLRTSQVHKLNNEALNTPIARFLTTMHEFLENRGGSSSVMFTEDSAFVNKRLLRVDASRFEMVDGMRAYFWPRDVGELVFSGPLDESTLRTFLEEFKSALTDGTPLFDRTFGPFMLKKKVNVKETTTSDDGGASMDIRRNVVRVYAKTMVFMQDFFDQVLAGKMPPMSKLRRIMQELIDISTNTEHLFLGLIQLKEYKEHLYNHSVNVAILSLMMGKQLGLNKRDLIELGLSALFHDVGKAKLPRELQLELVKAEGQHRALIEELPINAVDLVLGKQKVNRSVLRQTLVAYELTAQEYGFQRLYDHNGMLLSQVVGIANAFDSMTTRTATRKACTPDEALRRIKDGEAGHIDPRVFQSFSKLVGVTPIGSTVLLDGGQVAVVFNVHRDAGKFSRPIVRLLSDPSNAIAPGTIVDLADNADKGIAPSSIIKTIDLDELPEPPAVNMPQVFFA